MSIELQLELPIQLDSRVFLGKKQQKMKNNINGFIHINRNLCFQGAIDIKNLPGDNGDNVTVLGFFIFDLGIAGNKSFGAIFSSEVQRNINKV